MNWLRRKLINILVRRLFNGITDEDVLRIVVKNGQRTIAIRRRTLSKEEVEQIKSDAKAFQDSVIWQVLRDEVRLAANKRMFDRSQTVDDLLMGKAILFVAELIDSKLSNIAKL